MDVETIEKICKTLPHVAEEIKWKSDLVFMIASKMFCVVDLEAVPVSVAFKVAADHFDEVAARPYFIPAPYFAQHKWVTLTDASKITPSDLEAYIKTSYELVKAKLSKRKIQELDSRLP